MFGDELACRPRVIGLIRIFVDGAAGDVEIGNLVVEEADERAHQPALGLALFAEKEHVVPGEQGEVDFGDDGVLVADDAGEERPRRSGVAQEVVADLVL